MNANDGSVIVATGTAPGRGGRILVRCSGEGLLAHADDLLSGRGLDAARRRERGCFVDTLSIPSPALTSLDADPDALHGAGSLPCIVAVLPGPTTFTGEDVLEVEIPGNPALGTIVNRVLIAHFDRRTGHARAAGPGEFSARAFLAGRLSIQDATGIAASIAAANCWSWRIRSALESTRVWCRAIRSSISPYPFVAPNASTTASRYSA